MGDRQWATHPGCLILIGQDFLYTGKGRIP